MNIYIYIHTCICLFMHIIWSSHLSGDDVGYHLGIWWMSSENLFQSSGSTARGLVELRWRRPPAAEDFCVLRLRRCLPGIAAKWGGWSMLKHCELTAAQADCYTTRVYGLGRWKMVGASATFSVTLVSSLVLASATRSVMMAMAHTITQTLPSTSINCNNEST